MRCNLHLTTAYGGASPQGEALIYRNFNSLPLEGKVPRNEADEVSKEIDKLPMYRAAFQRSRIIQTISSFILRIN